ncbi:MAG: tetratricopeptide repeat protein [Ignavibacteriaceae bacterium]|nr:tetratricopeptide repeat protein [Ignavibacteriaceae bacterium]
MKFKTAYLYPLLMIVLGAGVVLYTQLNGEEKNTPVTQSGMPQDDIHSALPPSGDAPSKANVNENYLNMVKELKAKIEANPADTLSMRELAELYYAGHKVEEAFALYNAILEKNPKRTDILFELTQYYYDKQNYAEAEKVTQRILSYDKNNFRAMYNLGALMVAKGDKEGGKKQWQMIIEKFPGTEAAKLAAENLGKI